MLVLKTLANINEFPRTIAFDEIDSCVGERIREAVVLKRRQLLEMMLVAQTGKLSGVLRC